MNDIRSDLADAEKASAHNANRLASALSSSMFWNIASNFATSLITVVIFVFLTYKLDASVFGLFALGVIIVDFFYFQARSAGVDAALQQRAYSPLEMDTVFWATTGVMVLVIIVCAFGGVWLANANNEPSLVYLMPALALTLLPVPLAIPSTAVVIRNHDFRGGAIRNIVGAVAGGLAALIVVFSPYAEWALVAQRGVQSLVSSVIMAMRINWWPGFRFSVPYAAHYLQNSGRIFAAQAIASSFMRVLDLVVAFSFGTAAVGFMRIAGRFVEIINGTFLSPISSLWVMLLAEGNQTKGDRDLLYRRLSQMSALVCLPIFAGLALTSADVVDVALSDDYAPTAPMLAIMCVAGLLAPLTFFRNAAMVAIKRVNLLIAFSVLDVIILIAASLALSSYSANAVVASLLIVEAVRALMTVPVLLKDMHTKPLGLFMSMMPAYVACAVMAVIVLFIKAQTPDLDPVLRLGLKVVAGGAGYAGYLLIFHRDWSMTALSMLRPKKRADGPIEGEPTPTTNPL